MPKPNPNPFLHVTRERQAPPPRPQRAPTMALRVDRSTVLQLNRAILRVGGWGWGVTVRLVSVYILLGNGGSVKGDFCRENGLLI